MGVDVLSRTGWQYLPASGHIQRITRAVLHAALERHFHTRYENALSTFPSVTRATERLMVLIARYPEIIETLCVVNLVSEDEHSPQLFMRPYIASPGLGWWQRSFTAVGPW